MWKKKAKRTDNITESQQKRETLLKKYPNLEKLLLAEPGDSPWYQWRIKQQFKTPRGTLKWVDAPEDDCGSLRLFLVDKDGVVFGIVRSHTTVRQLDENRLLISYQTRFLDARYRDPDNTDTLDMTIMRMDDLRPVENPVDHCKNMKTGKRQFLIAGPIEAHCALPLKVSEGIHSFVFPEGFKSIPELLHVAEYLPHEKLPNQQYDTALYILRPKENEFEVFPQDWYNLFGWDDLYWFPDKAARDPISGRIFITGMRVGHHVLDQSNRRLEGEAWPPWQ